MTMTPFTCERFADQLADYLEHDADAATVAAMDVHAAGCAECRGLRTDLQAIASGAAMLAELEPPRDLWEGIAERIEAPVVPLHAAGAGRAVATRAPRRAGGEERQARRWWRHPALAAAALVGITAGVTYTATREAMQHSAPETVVATAPAPRGDGVSSASGPEGAARDAAATQQVAAGTPASGGSAGGAGAGPARPPLSTGTRGSAAAHTVAYRPGELAALDSLYYREIVRLRQVLTDRRGQLDSTTVEVLDRNMLVIDRAIRECREALAADPASRFLNEQLNEALEAKIELLRTAATMSVGE